MTHGKTAAPLARETTAALKGERAGEFSSRLYPTPLPQQTLVLGAPPIIVQAARGLARLRTAGHDHCRRSAEDLGRWGNERADYYGLLAEFLLLLEMERQGRIPEGYTLIADRAPVGPDFRLGTVTYNVKTVPPGNRYLCISELQRQDPRHAADFIFPTAFCDPTHLLVYRPIPVAEVASWPLRQGRSLYRSTAIEVLKPLRGFEEVLP